MKVRNDYIHFWRGRQFFAVRPTSIDGSVKFVGSLNGRECGAWPSKEATVQALLRRAAFVSPMETPTSMLPPL